VSAITVHLLLSNSSVVPRNDSYLFIQMRPAIFAAALALASPTLATPITARDDCSSDPTVFRFLFGAYCLVDSTVGSNRHRIATHIG
jgi:hypothetical protein